MGFCSLVNTIIKPLYACFKGKRGFCMLISVCTYQKSGITTKRSGTTMKRSCTTKEGSRTTTNDSCTTKEESGITMKRSCTTLEGSNMLNIKIKGNSKKIKTSSYISTT